MTATRAAVYARISKDVVALGLGVERQRDACLSLCEQRGWAVSRNLIFTDNDVSASGARSKRVAFASLLAAVAAGEVDVIVVHHVDRLVRRLDELERVIELCERQGVKIITVTGDLDLATDAGRLNARILASVARAEVERKSARQRDANRQAAAMGKAHSARRAFGFADANHLHPVESPIVAQMYDQFNSGVSLGGLARWLNEQGVSTPSGKQWKYNSVRSVLANPRNAGLRGIRELVDTAVGGSGRRARWHTITAESAAWPPIVPREAWEAAMRVLQDPERRTNYVGNRQQYLLSGLAICAAEGCGQKMVTGRRDKIRTLRCPSLRHANRRADYLEQFVVDVILERLRKPDAIDLVQPQPGGVDIAALRDRSALLRRRLAELAEDFGAGDLTRAEYRAAREAAHAKLAELDTILADLGRVDVLAGFVGADQDPGVVWDGAGLEIRRGVINALAEISIGPGRAGRPGQGPDAVVGTVSFGWRRRG